MPRREGCDIGPLMTGACSGAASGAGIRLSKVGICGAGSAKNGADRWARPPPPCAKPAAPPRAKPSVEPATQASANTAAKRAFMIAFLALLVLPTHGNLIVPRETALSVLLRLQRSCRLPAGVLRAREIVLSAAGSF